MTKNLNRHIAVFISFLMMCVVARADDKTFQLMVDQRTVELGSGIYLRLLFSGTQNIPVPALEATDDYTATYVGPSTQISIVNGRTSSSITHTFSIMPEHVGEMKIGPLRFTYNNDTYTSDSVTISVVDAVAGARSEANAQTLGEKIFLEVAPEKKHVFVNEAFPIKIKLYVNQLRIRNIQYPDLSKEPLTFSSFSQPQQYQETKNGISYEVVEFETMALASQPGDYSLGPVMLTCDIITPQGRQTRSPFGGSMSADFESMFDGFFGGMSAQTMNVRAPVVPITVRALPQEGRPADFNGAVGVFSVDARITPSVVNVGDPVTIIVDIRGANVDSVAAPKLAFPEKDFKVYDPEIKTQGALKTFSYVVIPRHTQVSTIPPVLFSYFDADRGAYETVGRGPFSITVQASEHAQSGVILDAPSPDGLFVKKPEVLGEDIAFIKDSIGDTVPHSGAMLTQPWYWLLQVVPLLMYFVVRGIHTHTVRLKSDHVYAHAHRAPRVAREGLKKTEAALKNANAADFYEQLFKTLQFYLAHKLHLPSGGITADVAALLRAKHIDADIVVRIERLFADSDMARYAPSGIGHEAMARSYGDLKMVIDHLERIIK